MAGVALPVEARRRCVFVFEAAEPPADCPLVIDTSGAWFRPEGGAFIGSIPPPATDDQADLPLEVDRRMWDDTLWPALATRVPAFDRVRTTGAWAGYYEFNTFDHNAILGPHPVLGNLLFANGFSGHGIQQAPAVGRAIAELIAHGRYVTLDLSVFAYDRIAEGRPSTSATSSADWRPTVPRSRPGWREARPVGRTSRPWHPPLRCRRHRALPSRDTARA